MNKILLQIWLKIIISVKMGLSASTCRRETHIDVAQRKAKGRMDSINITHIILF